uniref:Uncharacterized protein n=1 Tax=Pavo cristatus TaxID=9049 RepID=A0A8C9EK60_PAVCR
MSGNLFAKKESESSSLQLAAGFLEEDGAIPTPTAMVLPHPIHPHPQHAGNQRCASSERDAVMAQCSDFQAGICLLLLPIRMKVLTVVAYCVGLPVLPWVHSMGLYPYLLGVGTCPFSNLSIC